jgi:peptidoglycan/xylan/chitin deacetylase (PgdA/CDA1 family)
LTFDDGPSHNVTPLILEVLEKYDVHATFFVLGNMCKKNGYLLNELRDRGHSIGVHSYSHELNKLLKDKDSFLNEVKMTEDVIKENLGEDFTTRLFRFPGGSFETYKQQYLNDLHDAGYVSVDWNALTGDSEYKNPKGEILLERFKATTLNKDRLIILMHDSESKEISADILPDIIEYLKFEGYEFAVLK